MDNNRTIHTQSAKETQEVGREHALSLVANIKRGVVVPPYILCLTGDLGSGKTTFVQGFARGLGIATRLLSPTFIIVRRYEIPQTAFWLYHIDLYRLEKENNLETPGIREILQNPYAVVAIEWAEKLTELPDNRQNIWFTVDEKENHHVITTSYTDKALSSRT